MHHEQDRAGTNRSQCDEPLLFVVHLVWLREGAWIIEYKRGALKADAMLLQVPPALCFIPFERHERS
jgi:hypothetical protein